VPPFAGPSDLGSGRVPLVWRPEVCPQRLPARAVLRRRRLPARGCASAARRPMRCGALRPPGALDLHGAGCPPARLFV